MVRTQIYIPEDVHSQLIQLAKKENTSLSKLIREGASAVIKKRHGKKSLQEEALKFFANPPKKYQIPLTGKAAIDLIRAQRDHE